MRTWTAAALALAFQGCAEKQGSEKLSGAMKPDIPVYEPSTLEDREDASYQAGMDFDSLKSYHAYHWSLRSPDPLEKVVAYYRTLALPEEEDELDLGDELEEEETELHLELPPGDSDSVSVTIQLKPAKGGGTRFTLRESVLAERRG
ncbi:MAG: hypothetical protein L0323_07300 [Planctomycetes bacterium]|nr:hypothetical protein [Planctomycetota bacterium]